MEKILTVTELTNNLKKLVEENFRFVLVTGEISNCKIQQPSGHIYFTIKDDSCQIRGVMWSTRARDLIFRMEDGLKVLIKGRITIYPSRGEYQIEAWEIKPEGIGELQLKFEQLKQKLYEEGIFDEEHKKELPVFPEHVAIITSKTGAVFHDFVKIVKRRFPVITIYLFQASVQGGNAAFECIEAFKAVESFHKKNPIDIIVIARGGGSFEDLFCFNDEALARYIFKCKIPVVSAIGHEVDYTICDFAADKRAPTPSAAAEMITPDINDLIEKLADFSYFCRSKIDQKVKNLYNSVKEVQSNYYFNRPKDLIYNYYQRLDELTKNITGLTKNKVNGLMTEMKQIRKTLHHIDPKVNLKKGYTIISDPNITLFDNGKKRIIKRAAEAKKKKLVDIEFYDGTKKAKIE